MSFSREVQLIRAFLDYLDARDEIVHKRLSEDGQFEHHGFLKTERAELEVIRCAYIDMFSEYLPK